MTPSQVMTDGTTDVLLKYRPAMFRWSGCVQPYSYHGVVLYFVVWYAMVQCSLVWYTMVQCGMVWYAMVQCGMVWYAMVQCGMVWYGAGRQAGRHHCRCKHDLALHCSCGRSCSLTLVYY